VTRQSAPPVPRVAACSFPLRGNRPLGEQAACGHCAALRSLPSARSPPWAPARPDAGAQFFEVLAAARPSRHSLRSVSRQPQSRRCSCVGGRLRGYRCARRLSHRPLDCVARVEAASAPVVPPRSPQLRLHPWVSARRCSGSHGCRLQPAPGGWIPTCSLGAAAGRSWPGKPGPCG